MPFHYLHFTRLTAGAVASPTAVGGIQDNYAALSASSNYTLPEPLRLFMGWALSATVTLARVNTPSLRNIQQPAITPVQQSATPLSLVPFIAWGPTGPMIPAADELGVDMDAGAAEQQHAGLWMHDGNMNFNPGSIITAHATAAITGTANIWNAGTFAFDQTLPAGRYQVIGMDIVGTRVVAARLIFPAGNKRPGCMGRTALTVLPNVIFRAGRLGAWGEFTNTAPPSLEILPTGGAGVTQSLFLDLVKVA